MSTPFSCLNRRSFLLSSFALLAGSLLESCSKSATSTPAPVVTAKPSIVAWGDSLTEGVGGTPYPTQLATLTGRTVKNFGIGGQVASQIAARQGGIPVTLIIQGNAFAGTSPVPVTSISNPLLSTPSTNALLTISGTVLGVKCLLSRTATGKVPAQIETYTITPTTSSAVAVPAGSVFVPDDGAGSRDATQILWLGRNDTPNFAGVDATIQQCLDYLTSNPKRYMVIGVLNGLPETKGTYTYGQVIAFNTPLASKYTSNYVSAAVPTDAEMSAVSYTPTTQDRVDIGNDTFPRGLRSDDYHLNTLNYKVFANRIAAKLTEKGW